MKAHRNADRFMAGINLWANLPVNHDFILPNLQIFIINLIADESCKNKKDLLCFHVHAKNKKNKKY